MADDNQPHQMLQAAQEKKEEQKESGLERLANEGNKALRGITNIGIGAAAISGATALFGLDGLLIASSFPIGSAIVEYARKDREGKFTSANFRDDSIAGALFAPLAWYGITATKLFPKLFELDSLVTNVFGYSVPLVSSLAIAGLAGLVLTPALTAVYYPLQYIIRNKTFKGLGEDLKKNYFKGLVKAAPLTAITATAIGASYALPFLAPYLFPYLAVSNIAYRILLSPHEVSLKKVLYAPIALPVYLVNGATSLLGNAYNTAYSAGNAITTAISNFFKTEPKPQPTPATAPAT